MYCNGFTIVIGVTIQKLMKKLLKLKKLTKSLRKDIESEEKCGEISFTKSISVIM